MGWWIGQISEGEIPVKKLNGDGITLCLVNIIRLEKPEHRGDGKVFVEANFQEFDSVNDATDFLRSAGVAI
jgi:hypothetical protein